MHDAQPVPIGSKYGVRQRLSQSSWTLEQPLLLGVLSNPLSGGNRKGLKRVKKLLAKYPQVLHREVCTPVEVAEALKKSGEWRPEGGGPAQ